MHAINEVVEYKQLFLSYTVNTDLFIIIIIILTNSYIYIYILTPQNEEAIVSLLKSDKVVTRII